MRSSLPVVWLAAVAASSVAAAYAGPQSQWKRRANPPSPVEAPAEPAAETKPADPWPSLDDVRRAVDGVLAAKTDYAPGDLLTRADATLVFRELDSLGWQVAAREQMMSLVLPDDHLIATQFRAPAGRKFMRKIALLPLGYDRIDRLVRLPQGAQIFRDLIKNPGGEKLIEYMTQSKGGENLGRQLSATARGADFNKPTGRLYTAAQLAERLQVEYAAAMHERSGGGGRSDRRAAKQPAAASETGRSS